MKKFLFVFILSLFLLSACEPVSRSVVAPPGVAYPAQPPASGGEKVVVMVTPTAGALASATTGPLATATASAPASGTATPAPSEPTQTPAQAPVSSSMPTQTLAELGFTVSTYTDKHAGLALDYPANWKVTSIPEADRASAYIYSAGLRSADVQPGPKQQEGIPEGMTAVDINVYNQGTSLLEEAARQRRESATTNESGRPLKIVTDEDWTLPSGLKAHYFLYNIGPVGAPDNPGPDRMVAEIVAIVNGRQVLLSGQGDITTIGAIAASLREEK